MFGFPSVLRRPGHKFVKNLLQSAVFQIRFPSNNNIINKQDFLVNKLSSRYPNFKSIKNTHGNINIRPDGTPILSSSLISHDGVEFRSDNQCRILGITKDALTLTILGHSYTNFAEISAEFQTHYMPIMQELEVSQLARVAIRKINMVDAILQNNSDANKKDCKDIMGHIYNNALISGMQILPSNATLTRTISNISLNNSNNYQLNINYGFIGLNPQDPKIGQFTYDIDLFKTESNIDISRLNDEFDKINSEVYNIFIWGIKDSLIKSLSNA